MQLVAPAGSVSALKAAINAGADAVYLGMPRFGARAKAQNFEPETLRESIEYAHFFGVKVFVTLNTLIKDSELDEALELARFAYDCGADAAIVQDIRFIKTLKNKLPNLTLHASTQMGIHNADGAKAILDMGISRAVLSRETTPDDIEFIKKTGIDIEFFVQGALCVCFSGNCYFSSLASTYSGNRGKCMQLCRKKYRFNGKDGYFLSAKDICLYDRLSELSALGVDAIKIEGRMRSDEYVSRAVSVYKSHMPPEDAVDALKCAFNRGDYCSAYLDEGAQFNVIYSKSQANIGKYVGKIVKIKGNRLIINEHTPHTADGYKIMRNGEEVGGASVVKGNIVSDAKIKVGDEVRLTFDGRLSDEVRSLKRTVPVNIDIAVEEGKAPVAVISSGDISLTLKADTATETAKTIPISSDDVIRVFQKTADKAFKPDISVKVSGSPFMTVSALNQFRRSAYNALSKKIISRLPVHRKSADFSLVYNKFEGSGTILVVDSFECIDEDIACRVDYIALSPRDFKTVNDMRYSFNKPVLLELPVIMRGDERDIIKRAIDAPFICGVISNNYYSLGLTQKPILLGTGHNIIGECDMPHIRSFEADDICDKSGVWTYVYGYAPVMTLCHCPYGKCVNCSGRDVLTDESGRRFALRRYKLSRCYWQLLNCVPHNLIINSLNIPQNKYYDCRGMQANDIKAVLKGEFLGEYTRGNINKGLK